MPIVLILNLKGGCDKTIISANLPQAICNRNSTVLLVDTDPQGTRLARDLEDNLMILRLSTVRIV